MGGQNTNASVVHQRLTQAFGYVTKFRIHSQPSFKKIYGSKRLRISATASMKEALHELAHAYNSLTNQPYASGGFVVSTEDTLKDEGVAYSLEQYINFLDRLKIVEDGLDGSKSVKTLRHFWSISWADIRPGAYDVSISNNSPHNRVSTIEDIQRATSQLGYSMSCKVIAQKFNETTHAQRRGLCFVCTTPEDQGGNKIGVEHEIPKIFE